MPTLQHVALFSFPAPLSVLMGKPGEGHCYD
jgi:hypothetical protein